MSRSSRGQIPGEGERAVALQYSPGNGAPVIVASGMGHLAEKIVEVAVESGVPVYEDNSLATVFSMAGFGRQEGDFDSEEDHCVTVRFRDSMEQERVAIDQLDAYFADKFDF